MAILFKEVTIRLIENSYPKLDILHLSDFHLRGPNRALEKFIKKTVSKRMYDLVFFTGDLVDKKEGIEPFMDYVSLLKARYGIFAVWGNHDQFNLAIRHRLFLTKILCLGFTKMNL